MCIEHEKSRKELELEEEEEGLKHAWKMRIARIPIIVDVSV